MTDDVTIFEILTQEVQKSQVQSTKLVAVSQEHVVLVLETACTHAVLVESCQRFSALGKSGVKRSFKLCGVGAVLWLRLHSAAPVYIPA